MKLKPNPLSILAVCGHGTVRQGGGAFLQGAAAHHRLRRRLRQATQHGAPWICRSRSWANHTGGGGPALMAA